MSSFTPSPNGWRPVAICPREGSGAGTAATPLTEISNVTAVSVLNSDFVKETPAHLAMVLPSVFDLVTPLLGNIAPIQMPAFAGFTLAAALSGLYLWQERRLKRRVTTIPRRPAPSRA